MALNWKRHLRKLLQASSCQLRGSRSSYGITFFLSGDDIDAAIFILIIFCIDGY